MGRSIAKLFFLSVLVVAGFFAVRSYQRRNSVEVQFQQEQQKNAKLRQIVQHLNAEKRVADVIVTEQQPVDGKLMTTLLFVEYARDGSALPPKRFCIEGKMVHIDAMVVKFEGKYVEEMDPLRGHSIALFTRIYGDKQSPDSAHRIDDPNHIPEFYRNTQPQVVEYERKLWKDFWRLAEDESHRKSMGVRVAQGEGVWGPFEKGRLYALTLESDGGLNLTSENLKGIYRAALQRD